MTTCPHLGFSWGAQSKMNSSLSAKDPQNEPLEIIHVLRRLAGSWEECCFSLPFPQIAVSVNTQHHSSVSLGGSSLCVQGLTLEPVGLRTRTTSLAVCWGRGPGICGSPSPPSPELGS